MTAYTPSPAPMVEQAGELKPCPFCGAAARIWEGPSMIDIACTACEAQPAACVDQSDRQVALAAWNTRPAPAETEGVHLKNLLAIIHRDGGQYLDTHGLDKAVEDAIRLSAERIASTPPADAGMLREALQGFVDDLTDRGRNRDTCITINHDELAARIKEARAALNSQAHQIREGDHD